MTLDLSNEEMLAFARLVGSSSGTQEANERFVHQISDFMLAACRSISWHDRRAPWPRIVLGGSGFVLRFRHRLIGVTVAHVVNAYRDDLAKTPTLVLQLDLAEFDLLGGAHR
jgi:hypothetical protein